MRKVKAPFRYQGPTINKHFSHRRVRARLVIEDTELYLFRYQEFQQSMVNNAYELAIGIYSMFMSREPKMLVAMAKALYAAGYHSDAHRWPPAWHIAATELCSGIYKSWHDPDVLAAKCYAQYQASLPVFKRDQ